MNVFPQAIALANIHIGTIAGKLNGVIPGRHAEWLTDLIDIDSAADLLRITALEQVRDAGRELEVLQAAGDLAERVGRNLAVLGSQERGQLLAVLIDQVPDAEHDLGALRE